MMDKSKEIKCQYVKANDFRVCYAVGAYGGVSGDGNIQFALYNERHSIPQESVLTFHEEDSVSEKVEKRFDGIHREVEVNVIMNPVAAKALADWLMQKVEEASKIMNEANIKEEQ